MWIKIVNKTEFDLFDNIDKKIIKNINENNNNI